MIKIIIATSNAAFDDGYKELESSRIVSEAADKVESDQFDFKLRDINGNTVGRLEETDDEPDLEPGSNYIVLGIATDNAAFEDNGKGRECARILREAATKMRDGDLDFKLRDINGNTVGRVEEVAGEVQSEAKAETKTSRKFALLVGSMKEGFVVQSILDEANAQEAVSRAKGADTTSSKTAVSLPLTDAQVDKMLRARIPGGSEASHWFLPHEQPKGLANVRDVVRAMHSAAPQPQPHLLADWKLAEAIEIIDPSQHDAAFEADPDGELVVIFGTLSAGLEAYGPFGDHGAAVEFADNYLETYDTQYEIFHDLKAVENALAKDGSAEGCEP